MNLTNNKNIPVKGVMLLGATAAASSGAVITSGPYAGGAGVSVSVKTPSESLYLNVLTSTVSVKANSGVTTGASEIKFSPLSSTAPEGKFEIVNGSGTTGIATKYAAGQVIDSSLTFKTGTQAFVPPGGGWNLGDRGYFAFRIEDTVPKYGWVDLSWTGTSTANTVTVYSYAYENSGSAISAGQIPEPSAPILVAGCAAAFAARRRRQDRAAA